MLKEKEIPIYDFVNAISEMVDMVSPVLSSHHKKVAYISYRIARQLQLPTNEIQDIVLASMLHDIGAFSMGERISSLEFGPLETGMDEHAIIGYKLLKDFAPLTKAAKLIKNHHTDYDLSEQNISIGSCIIHLADKVSILYDEHHEILAQVPDLLEKISLHNHKFHPSTLAAFGRLAKLEYFWVEAFTPTFSESILKEVLFQKKLIGIETLQNFAKVIAQIIDFRSRFTATHSSGVSAVAREITAISGFSESECRLMEIAGYLHDLGKLAVPNEILEKNGKLNEEEFNCIRKHTYNTYAVLSKIDGMGDVAKWAAYHHERQDGSGYPFHVKSDEFPKLARVMSVADIFTALTEDRPYRLGMNRGKTSEILLNMAENGGIDRSIVELANYNFLRINDARAKAQRRAMDEYIHFRENSNQLIERNDQNWEAIAPAI